MTRANTPSRIPLIFALALLLGGCSPTTPRAEDVQGPTDQNSRAATPPFFRVEGGKGARLEIMGTVHLGPPGGWQFTRPIQKALENADALVLELDPTKVDENEVGDVLASIAILPVGTELEDVVLPLTQKLLEDQDLSLGKIGFPIDARRRMQPWYLAISIVTREIGKSGFLTDQSAEAAIVQAAGTRPIIGLENSRMQLELLSGFTPGVQDIILRDTLERRNQVKADAVRLVEAWRTNNTKELEEVAYQGAEIYPELGEFYDRLLVQRNKRWAKELRKALEDPSNSGKSFFVGVGAAHLVGEGSLIDLLREAGYRVTTQTTPALSRNSKSKQNPVITQNSKSLEKNSKEPGR